MLLMLLAYVNIQFVSSIRILNKNSARARGQNTCIFDIILLLTVTIVHVLLLYEVTLTTTMRTSIYSPLYGETNVELTHWRLAVSREVESALDDREQKNISV